MMMPAAAEFAESAAAVHMSATDRDITLVSTDTASRKRESTERVVRKRRSATGEKSSRHVQMVNNSFSKGIDHLVMEYNGIMCVRQTMKSCVSGT